MLGTILVIILIFALLGALPLGGSYNASWGYASGGAVGVVLIIVVILLLTGRL